MGKFLVGRSVDEQRPGGQFGIPIKIQSVSAVRPTSAVSGSGGETLTQVWAHRGTPLTRTPAHTRLEADEHFRGNHRDRGSPSRLFWWDAGASHQVILTPSALTRGCLAAQQGPRGSPSPVIIPRPGAAAVPGAVGVQGTLQGSSIYCKSPLIRDQCTVPSSRLCTAQRPVMLMVMMIILQDGDSYPPLSPQ